MIVVQVRVSNGIRIRVRVTDYFHIGIHRQTIGPAIMRECNEYSNYVAYVSMRRPCRGDSEVLQLG